MSERAELPHGVTSDYPPTQNASRVAESTNVVSVADEHTEFVWHVHSYTNEYIRFADTKAGAVVVFATALVGALHSAGLTDQAINASGTRLAATGLSILAFVALLAAISLGAWVIWPRLPNQQPTGYVYWESILAHGGVDDFVVALTSQKGSDLTKHVAAHLYVLASISKQKYKWVSISVAYAVMGGVAGVAALLVR